MKTNYSLLMGSIFALTIVVGGCKKNQISKAEQSLGSKHSSIFAVSTSCNIQLGDFRTQSKGGWGAKPSGSNSAQYMHNNWSAIGSVTIGSGSTTMSFNSASAVTAYLPNGKNTVAPFNTNLATQTLALTLSIAFDNHVASFGASNDHLQDLVLDSGDFIGWSVAALLAEANKAIAGASSYSTASLVATLEKINVNFEGGTTNKGWLTCGGCEISLGDYRTQSKGGWGSSPNGSNPGQYLEDHWSAIGSVTIGSGSTTKSFNSAYEVEIYLPNGSGSSSPFNTNLATQTLALSISIALDLNVDDFGASDNHLKCLKVAAGTFKGWTVQAILDEANAAIAGSSSYSSADLVSIIESINTNFENGTIDNGVLECATCD